MPFVTPLTGFNAAVRLFLPIGPDWVVQFIWWLISLASAVNAAGLATVQSEARRFFANLLVSHTALLMIGLELHTQLYPRGALCLWFSVTLSHGGSGSTLRALEAQSGRWTLTGYHGLDEHSPTLAVCFLMPGLESVGFPGTKSFVAAKLLVDGAVEANLYVGLAVVLATATNGIVVERAYPLLFTRDRQVSTIAFEIAPWERFAVLTFSASVLRGGILLQPGAYSRHGAAVTVLADHEMGKSRAGHEIRTATSRRVRRQEARAGIGPGRVRGLPTDE